MSSVASVAVALEQLVRRVAYGAVVCRDVFESEARVRDSAAARLVG